jgi:hypothetical protein
MELNTTVELNNGKIGTIQSKFINRGTLSYEFECEGVRTCITNADIQSVIMPAPIPSVTPECLPPAMGTASPESKADFVVGVALNERKFADARGILESEIAALEQQIQEKRNTIKTLDKTYKGAIAEAHKLLKRGLCMEAAVAQVKSLFPGYASR